MLAHQAARAFSAGQTDRTDRLLARIIELQPNNPVALADYGQFKSRVASRGQYLVADRARPSPCSPRAIAASEAAGRPAPQAWYLRALATGYDSTRPPVAATRWRRRRSPSRAAWSPLIRARSTGATRCSPIATSAPADPTLDLDIRRLARAAEAMVGERDYIESAEALEPRRA